MKALIPVFAIGLCLSPWAVSSGLAGDSLAFAERPLMGAPNRLDIYDLKREFAREAEHRRIRTRLGDPDLGCRAALMDRVEVVTPAAGIVVIVCR